MKPISSDVKTIEDFVNSQEGCDILDPDKHLDKYENPDLRSDWVYTERWNEWLAALNAKLSRPLDPDSDFTQDLLDDLADWESNGNMHPWAEGETNDFGMTRWRLELSDAEFNARIAQLPHKPYDQP